MIHLSITGTDCDGGYISKVRSFCREKCMDAYIEEENAWADGPLYYSLIGVEEYEEFHIDPTDCYCDECAVGAPILAP